MRLFATSVRPRSVMVCWTRPWMTLVGVEGSKLDRNGKRADLGKCERHAPESCGEVKRLLDSQDAEERVALLYIRNERLRVGVSRAT
jgi:hypothetical protein